MTRVVLLTSIAYSLPNFRASLIALLVASGAEVLALAPDYDDRTRERVRNLGARPVDCSMRRAGMNPLRDLADAARLTAQLRQLKPDAILSYFAKPVIYGSVAAAIARVPRRIAMIEGLGYVFGEDETRSLARRVLRGVTKAMYRIALGQVDDVLFLNADDHRLFTGEGVVDGGTARNIGGVGVDLSAFAVAPAVTHPVSFILAARLLREKGIEYFVAAARELKGDYPDARFILLGGVDPNPSGISADEVRRWVGEGVIEWPGHVEDVRPWIAGASVFVLPSYYREGVPRSIQEAMAMGKPIVTTDNVGCRDTVEDGVNGWLVPPRDARALAAAMRRLIDAPDRIAPMGLASRRLAEQRFDAHRTDRLLRDLLLG